jgi:hypothetical protein
MTDAVLWALAVALGAAAVWLARPRPLPVDPSRLFAVLLATLHRGEVERAKGTVSDWKARLEKELPRDIRAPDQGWDADPVELGAAWAGVLGPGVSWDDVADGKADVALERKLADVVFAEAEGVADGEALLALCLTPAARLVVRAGPRAAALLRWLHGSPALRDRIRAVVLVHPILDGAWMAQHWRQDALDTELARTVPWLVLRSGAERVPAPAPSVSGREAVAVHDLGIVAEPEDPLVGRAVRMVVALASG